MSKIEISVPDGIASEIDHLVEQGEFLSRDQAVEELLSRGVSAYDVEDDDPEGLDQDLFTQAVEDQQDPAQQKDPSEGGPTF